MTTLYLIRGLPGSGKTTYAKTKFPNLFHVENDMVHYDENGQYHFDINKKDLCINFCKQCITNALSNNINCVISNVFVSNNSINQYKEIADKYQANFKVIRLVSQFENQHSVPNEVLESMKSSFEDYPDEEIIDISK